MTDAFELDGVLSKYTHKPSEAANPELALLYSRPGGGKTYLAATISQVPGVNKTLILDTEGSTVGALNGFDDDKIDVIDCRKGDGVQSFMFLDTVLGKLVSEQHSYDAIIIDTFDIAQEWCKAAQDANPPLNDRGRPDGFALWGNVRDWSLRVARDLKRIKPYGILVVHEKEAQDEDGVTRAKLNLVGAAKDILPGIPDMVVYLQRRLEDTDGDSHEVTYGYFASEDNKVTKNRFQFPQVVKNPTFPGLFKYIEAKNGGTP